MTNSETIIEAPLTLAWCCLESELCECSCELGRVGSLEPVVLAARHSHSFNGDSYVGNGNMEMNVAGLYVLYDRYRPNCWSCFMQVSLSVPPSSAPQHTDP